MDIEIKIGRGVDGPNACRVPDQFAKVSRQHATLYFRGGIATLVDNGSSNGTFVNGLRITNCQVNENDSVWLGGNGTDEKCYRLDLRSYFSAFRGAGIQPQPYTATPAYHQQPAYQPQPQAAAPAYQQPAPHHGDDYSKEFEQVKQVYVSYHEELDKLTKKASLRMQIPRLLLSLIPISVGLIIMLVSTNMTMRIVGMSAGTVLSGLISTLTMGKGNKKKEKLTEDIMDLELKYKNQYKCPKCGKPFSLDLHWKKIKAEGKCPFGCGARF